MRGVAGIAFVFLGLVMGYMVLSGKFPSSGNLVSTPTSGTTVGQANTAGTGFNAQGLQTAENKGNDMSSIGLPTVANLNDLVPSNGGYYPSNQH